MRQCLLAAAENFGLLFRRQFVAFILDQIVPVFLEPARELFPFLKCERED